MRHLGQGIQISDDPPSPPLARQDNPVYQKELTLNFAMKSVIIFVNCAEDQINLFSVRKLIDEASETTSIPALQDQVQLFVCLVVPTIRNQDASICESSFKRFIQMYLSILLVAVWDKIVISSHRLQRLSRALPFGDQQI